MPLTWHSAAEGYKMKLLHKIKSILYELICRRHLIKKRYAITAKGRCYVQYLIDKYINSTKPDNYIEAYEVAIQDKVSQWREKGEVCIWFLPKDTIPINIPEGELLTLAAIQSLTALLSIASKEEQRFYCDQIKDDFPRNMISQVLEKGYIYNKEALKC